VHFTDENTCVFQCSLLTFPGQKTYFLTRVALSAAVLHTLLETPVIICPPDRRYLGDSHVQSRKMQT
jgi:hypothetical protein